MPRKANPNLERAIVDAAVRILEAKGIDAVTMREVAKAAGTTTPTLYERFKDRDALIDAITDVHRDKLLATLSPRDSLEQLGRKFFRYCHTNCNSVDLLLKRIAGNLRGKTSGPVYELVRLNLIKVSGLNASDAEEMAMATSSMVFGTALLMSSIGSTHPTARRLQHATLNMMRRLVDSYKE